MLFKRLEKINHLVSSKFYEHRNIKEISSLFVSGNALMSSFKAVNNNDLRHQDAESLVHLDLYREQLLNSEELVDYSLFDIIEKKKVSDIYKKASSPKVWCHFFYLLTRNFNAKNILEIGTNLGVSGQYFIKALCDNKNKESTFITFEGLPDLCKISNKRFSEIVNRDFCEFKIIEGIYKNTLIQIDEIGIKYDIFFIDGNHKYKPTIEYYTYLLKHSKDNVIFIFDDINWSEEMKKAWIDILKTDYSFSINFYKLGVVVIEKNKLLKKNYNMFMTF